MSQQNENFKTISKLAHQGCESECVLRRVSSAGDGWRVLALLEGEGDVGGVAGVVDVGRQGLQRRRIGSSVIDFETYFKPGETCQK